MAAHGKYGAYGTHMSNMVRIVQCVCTTHGGMHGTENQIGNRVNGDVYHRVKIIDIQFEKRVTHKNHRVTLAASAKHTAGFKYGVEHIVWH